MLRGTWPAMMLQAHEKYDLSFPAICPSQYVAMVFGNAKYTETLIFWTKEKLF